MRAMETLGTKPDETWLLEETGKNLSDMSLEEMEVYWQEAKGREQK